MQTYRRFLNDSDYNSIITSEALHQITRGDMDRLIQTEQTAEMSIIEFLTENYQIEQEFNKGKFIAEYDRRITFPVGVHIYWDGQIYKVIRSISGFKSPSDIIYWEQYQPTLNSPIPPKYSQFNTYYPGDVVLYNEVQYVCMNENGHDFGEIRIPMCVGWSEVETCCWMPKDYGLWDVVEFDSGYYTLIELDGFDNNVDPVHSDCWGAIADYDPNYNEYILSPSEYVVYNSKVFVPEMDVNSDIPVVGKNLVVGDPRNYNLVKHMVRISIYELTKLIAPNNVSTVRIRDYEESMRWLSDVSKLKRNPKIPRRLGEDKKEVLDWQLCTFQAEYDPSKNPWLI